MLRDKAPILSRTLGRCDVCYKPTHLAKLKYMLREWLSYTADNLFAYSSYNSAYWTVTSASDEGAISFTDDNCRYRVNLDDTTTNPNQTTTEINGTQTWSGTGIFRNTTAVDISGASTNVVFAIDVGLYHGESDRTITIAMGFTDSSGSQFSAQLSPTLRGGSQRFWFSTDISNLPGFVNTSAAYFYVGITQNSAGQKWYVNRAQLEVDVEKPGAFAVTAGAAISRTDSKVAGKAKVCPDCISGIHRQSELTGRPEAVTPDIIETVEVEY